MMKIGCFLVNSHHSKTQPSASLPHSFKLLLIVKMLVYSLHCITCPPSSLLMEEGTVMHYDRERWGHVFWQLPWAQD